MRYALAGCVKLVSSAVVRGSLRSAAGVNSGAPGERPGTG
jgi:hypothetical protein